MSDGDGLNKNRCRLFRPSFSTGIPGRKSEVFRLDPPVGELSRKSFFSTVKGSPIWASVEKGRLSTDKSDCVRNSLMLRKRCILFFFSGAPSSRVIIPRPKTDLEKNEKCNPMDNPLA